MTKNKVNEQLANIRKSLSTDTESAVNVTPITPEAMADNYFITHEDFICLSEMAYKAKTQGSKLTEFNFIDSYENIPSDDNNFLKDFDCCLKVLSSFKELVYSSEYALEFEICFNYINREKKESDNLTNQVLIDSKLNSSKIFILSLAKLIFSTVKTLAIKEGISYKEFKEITKDYSQSNNKNNLEFLPFNGDLREILEGLKKIFPEFNIPELKESKRVLAPKLFLDAPVTKTSSSLVADSMFKFCVGSNLSLIEISQNLSKVTSKYTTGSIDFLFEQVESVLVKSDYGEDTFKLFTILVAYWYQHKDKSKPITVSGSDILSYLNKLYQKTDKNTKRVKKVFNLQWLANHCKLLKRIDVYSTGISPKNGGKFSLSEKPLIQFTEISYYPCQSDIYGNYDLSEITDLTVKFKMGDWFDYFDNPKYSTQFAFTHQKALSSCGMLSNFLHWITIATRQNQKGNFRVEYILESIGYKKEIEDILADKGSGYKAKDFFTSFNRMISEAQSIEDSLYTIDYAIPPEWQKRKPRGWFSQFLNLTLTIKDKEYLKTFDVKKEVIPPEPKQNKLTVTDLKSALAQYSDNKNVSLRKLAEAYGTSHPTLSRKLKSGKFTQFELRDLIKWVHILGKKKS